MLATAQAVVNLHVIELLIKSFHVVVCKMIAMSYPVRRVVADLVWWEAGSWAERRPPHDWKCRYGTQTFNAIQMHPARSRDSSF
jgi:hypothetical protein